MITKNNLLFRDAGVLTSGKLGSLGHIKYCAEMIKNLCAGIEITLNSHCFEKEHRLYIDDICESIKDFELVVFHLSPEKNKLGDNLYTQKLTAVLTYFKKRLKNLRGVVAHPDKIDDFSVCKKMKFPDSYFGIEVLGRGCRHGSSIDEIRHILRKYAFCSIVLDTAHIMENISRNRVGVADYIKEFGDRIVEVHLSLPGNHYKKQMVGDKFKTSHSLLQLNFTDAKNLMEDFPFLPQPVNYVIEGVLPPNREAEFLKREAILIQNMLGDQAVKDSRKRSFQF